MSVPHVLPPNLRGRGRSGRDWLHRIALSCLGLLVTGSILVVMLVEKFADGGWMTVVITGVVIAFCLLNHAHYALVRRKIRAADEALGWITYPEAPDPPSLDPQAIPQCLWSARAVAAAFMRWSGCGENFRVNFATASS